MCDKWAGKDARIRVVHKQNAGLGSARNAGLEISTGEYILFADSDDWLRRNACEAMLDRILKDACDACMCGYREVCDDGQILHVVKEKKGIYSGKKMLRYILNGKARFSYSVWKFMYRRKDLRGLFFEEGLYYEDVNFLTRFLLKDLRIATEPGILYSYRQRNDSITEQRLTEKHVKDYICVTYEQIQTIKRYAGYCNISKYYWLSLLELEYLVYQNGRDKTKLKMIQDALSRIPLDWKKLDRKSSVKIFIWLYAMPVYVLYRRLRKGR